MRYHLTPVSMSIIKSIQILNARMGAEKRNLSNYCWECKLVQLLSCSMSVPGKTKNKVYHVIQQTHSWAYIQRKF